MAEAIPSWSKDVLVATPTNPVPTPALAYSETSDPSQDIAGMPPNFGNEVLPHAVTYQGIMSTISRVYRPSDEALKHSLDNARFMLNDPSVQECIEQRKRSTVLLDWDIEPEDPKNSTHQGLAAAMKDILQATPRFMQYRENLLHALWYGRYAVQNSFGWQNIKGHWRYVIKKWIPVNGDKLVFRFDDGSGDYDDEQIGIRIGAGIRMDPAFAVVWTQERQRKILPTDYGLAYFLDKWERPMLPVHKHLIEDAEYENPHDSGKIHGVGIRSRIYWVWYQRQEALAWLMEFLERSAFGIEMWYYPAGNANAKKEMQEAAATRVGQGRNMIFIPKPMGDEGMNYGVERIEPAMGGADILQRILQEYFGHQIKRYILGQTLTSEADATGMGSNLASVHLDTYLQIVKYDSTNLEETMTTEVLEPLRNLNFPSYQNVPLKFKILTEAQDVEGKLAAWKNAYDMGLKLRAGDVYDLVGASVPEDNEEVLDMSANQDAGGLGGLFGGGGFPGQQPDGVNDPTSSDGSSGTEVADLETTSDAMAEPYQAERYAWDESKHPRDDSGRFGEGGGSTVESKASRPEKTEHSIKEWEKSIGENGRKALGLWAEETHEEWREWDLEGEPDRYADDDEIEMFNAMKTAITTSPRHNGTVYRGMVLDDDDLDDWTTVGEVIQSNAMASWTKESKTAAFFSDPEYSDHVSEGTGVMLRLATTSGSDISGIVPERMRHEQEVVIDKGSSFRVASADYNEHKNRWDIILEEIL